MDIIHGLPPREILAYMDNLPAHQEIVSALSQINSGNVRGFDGIPKELFLKLMRPLYYLQGHVHGQRLDWWEN